MEIFLPSLIPNVLFPAELHDPRSFAHGFVCNLLGTGFLSPKAESEFFHWTNEYTYRMNLQLGDRTVVKGAAYPINTPRGQITK